MAEEDKGLQRPGQSENAPKKPAQEQGSPEGGKKGNQSEQTPPEKKKKEVIKERKEPPTEEEKWKRVQEVIEEERKERKKKIEKLIPPDIQKKSIEDQIAYLASQEKENLIAAHFLSEASRLIKTPSLENIDKLKSAVETIDQLDISEDKKEIYLLYLRNGTLKAAETAKFTKEEMFKLAQDLGMVKGQAARIEEVLLVETDPRFVQLPERVRRAIREYNNTIRTDVGAIDKHFLEGIRKEIAGSENIPVDLEDLRTEMLAKLKEQRLAVERTEKEERVQSKTIEQKVESVVDFQTRLGFQQLVNKIEEERHKADALRIIRSDLLDLVERGVMDSEKHEILTDVLQQLEIAIRTGTLSQQETTFVERARELFTERIQEITEAVARELKRRDRQRIDYERYGYIAEEREFIEQRLFNPKEAVEFIKDKGLEEFRVQVKKTFNKLYSKANRTPRLPFQESFSGFYDKPTLETFEQALELIKRYIVEHPEDLPEEVKGDKWEIKEYRPIRAGISKDLESRSANLAEMIEILREKMMREYEITEYTHNVYFIMLTRGKLENLAGYANRAHAVDLDTLFIDEEAIEQAYYFFLGEAKKALTNSFWQIDPTYFAPDPRTFKEFFENNTKEKLKTYYQITGRSLEDWELDRAVSMARGALLGITGELLDVIASSDAPKGEATFRGYFGDVVAGAINPMHMVERFHPGAVSDIFYALIRHKGTLEGWRWQQLEEVKKYLEKNLYSQGLTGKPLVEFLNLFGSGSVLARKGWRLTGATKHLLPGLGYERVGDKERYIWKDVDVDEAWLNLVKAGLGVAYTWADTIVKLDPTGMIPEEATKVKDLQEKITVENVLKEVKRRNPLKFLYDFDKSKKFDSSLRQRVVNEIPRFKGKKFNEIIREINEIEDRILLVQRRITEENRNRTVQQGTKEIEESDFDVLRNANYTAEQIAETKEYWRAMNKVLSITKEGKDVFVGGKKFKTPEYFFGSEDFHFEDLRFFEGGASLIGRLYGDMNSLATAATNYLQNLEPTFKKVSQSRDFHPLVELNTATRSVVQGIHGEDRATELSYITAMLNSRYFQKNWSARLPLLMGTLVDSFAGPSSFSKFLGGRNAWAWDEQMIARYIAGEVEAGNIPTKTRAEKIGLKFADTGKLICDITLREEVGARLKQVTLDVLRTAIPLIIAIMIVQALKKGMEDTQ